MKMEKDREFVPDSRFKAMGKEAVIVAVYWGIMFMGIMLSAHFLGGGDPKEYTYLFGFPLWFAICVVIIVVGIVMLLKVFKNVSLDAEDPNFDYVKGEKKK